MPNIDLSIILPGIRHQNWKALYDSIFASIGEYSFELIAVGPPGEHNFAADNFFYIVDYGAPARAAQLGVRFAQGDLITWASDDGVFLEGALEAAINLHREKDKYDVITMRYAEGGNSQGPEYWKAGTHADLRIPGVNPDWLLAPLGLYNREYFIDRS